MVKHTQILGFYQRIVWGYFTILWSLRLKEVKFTHFPEQGKFISEGKSYFEVFV